ncbi:hypothetical protein NQ318_011303 [Aromia moschata]|uniref:Transposase n=1 Tax=Aromia moschata TaxID=1265417 RepID=A0AAV8XX81_9CUCU|nr:hypothetical protein NQ318_011303 [Aromia moschata]
MNKSKTKTMLIAFFEVKGMVHYKFVLPGQTINAAYYLEVLRRLKRSVVRKRRDIKGNWKLHHDNALSHIAFIVSAYLARVNVTVVPPTVQTNEEGKTPMKGEHFGSVKNIQKACTDALKAIPENNYRSAFDAWKTRWNRCVDLLFVARCPDISYIYTNSEMTDMVAIYAKQNFSERRCSQKLRIYLPKSQTTESEIIFKAILKIKRNGKLSS